MLLGPLLADAEFGAGLPGTEPLGPLLLFGPLMPLGPLLPFGPLMALGPLLPFGPLMALGPLLPLAVPADAPSVADDDAWPWQTVTTAATVKHATRNEFMIMK